MNASKNTDKFRGISIGYGSRKLWVYYGYTGLRLFQVLKCGRTDIRELISQPARARLVSFEE